MSTEQSSAKSIFLSALDLQGEERAAFVERECRDNMELRAEVERLLDNPAASHFLESPAHALMQTGDFQAIQEREGSQVGPYRLMEQVGEGGFGLVFVAEQTQPVRRKVALKIIKPGMDTKEVIARFEAERQALALMDHPNIAKILDAGITESGRPFFAMELIRGVPISDYCDSEQLSTQERLQLFMDVCRAIQHAHSKGVIHRDLKPNNILVSPHDGRPVVKIIDFGISKALGQQLTDKTIYTRLNQMVGTPLYMSPEQAEINALDVDIRSDVYSLGVLLYELLTGTTPFDRERFSKAAYDEIKRIIREEEPPSPSRRLSSLGDTLKSVSKLRRMEPSRLTASVKGELDWIVMCCLEKDRSRRYQTAVELAADVERFLTDEPVLVVPPSRVYQARKALRKYRVPLAVMVGYIVLSSVGLVATLLAMQHANANAREAQRSSKKAAQLEAATQKYLTSLTQLFMSEIQSLALQGKFEDASKRLARAEDLRLGEPTKKTLEAQIELHKGNYAGAIRLLKSVRLEEHENSLTVDSMLALAYQRAGLEASHLQLIDHISSRECKTFSDYLYRGYALDVFFPERALEDLKHAMRLDRTSHMAMLIYGGALAKAGENARDPSVGLNQLLAGIEKLNAVRAYLPENSAVLNGLAIANFHCSIRCEELKFDEKAKAHKEEADRLFEELPLDSPNSFESRAAYDLWHADFKALERDYEFSLRSGVRHNHQAIAVAVGRYRRHQKGAVEVLAATHREFADSTAAMQIYALLDEIKTKEQLQQLVLEKLASRKEVPFVLSVFDWTLYRLLGDQEGMKRSTFGLRSLAKAVGENNWREHADFMEGKGTSAEKMIRNSTTRFNQAYGCFYAAFDALARGDRKQAQSYFEQQKSTHKYETHGFMWAEAFKKRLDDPNWLPWLNNKRAKSR